MKVNAYRNSPRDVQTARLIARVAGAIPCLFVLIYFSGSLDELKLAFTEGYDAQYIFPILAVLLTGIIGYGISWFYELQGGIIMGIAGLATAVYLYMLMGWDNATGMAVYALPFLIGGLLFINCWLRDYRHRKNRVSTVGTME